MYIIPKGELQDGKYYEGLTVGDERTVVARWNSEQNRFEYVFHHWTEPLLACLIYWDDSSETEYFQGFYPITLTEARDYEKVENYD